MNGSVLRATRYRDMRTSINKLNKGHSTKAERKFLEFLKELHIPFRTKVKICGQEVDFLIGRYAIEIDGHKQNVDKNIMLILQGFSPVHFNNWEITPRLKEWLKQLSWQEQDYSGQQVQPSR